MVYNVDIMEEVAKIFKRLARMADKGKISKEVFRYIMVGKDEP